MVGEGPLCQLPVALRLKCSRHLEVDPLVDLLRLEIFQGVDQCALNQEHIFLGRRLIDQLHYGP